MEPAFRIALEPRPAVVEVEVSVARAVQADVVERLDRDVHAGVVAIVQNGMLVFVA